MMRNKDNMHLAKYKTNKKIREKVDRLLHENAQIWSNLGTGTPLDVGTREEGEKKWKKIVKKIEELDGEFVHRISPYGIDS